MYDPARAFGDLVAAKHLKLGDALPRPSGAPGWNRAGLGGRLVEISSRDSSSALTAAFGLVLDVQRERETSAWVTSENSFFFPPDAAEGGVDLNALPVVRVPAGAELRAADKLARSGAFGLIVIDIQGGAGEIMYARPRRGEGSRKLGGGPFPRAGRWNRQADGALSRLLGLAQKHDIAILFLTRKSDDEPSLGSLVSLRGRARRTRVGADLHEVEVRALKDKRRAPGWTHAETCRGPAGLR
jgi:recombination protein RecA